MALGVTHYPFDSRAVHVEGSFACSLDRVLGGVDPGRSAAAANDPRGGRRGRAGAAPNVDDPLTRLALTYLSGYIPFKE